LTASASELVRDIKAYLARRNDDPKPRRWNAEGAEILAKIKRARAAPRQRRSGYLRIFESRDTSSLSGLTAAVLRDRVIAIDSPLFESQR